MKKWTHAELAELSNLYHLARTALSGSEKDTIHGRMVWASNEYSKLHPEVVSTAAYKALDRGTVPADEEIDISEIPELDASFFEGAILVRPGESLIEKTRRGGT